MKYANTGLRKYHITWGADQISPSRGKRTEREFNPSRTIIIVVDMALKDRLGLQQSEECQNKPVGLWVCVFVVT